MVKAQEKHAARWGAVLPAAGEGSRMRAGMGREPAGQPKQFLELGGRPVLIHALAALAGCPEIEAIVVAAPEELVSEVIKMIGRYGVGKVSLVVAGGQTRQESVRRGVAALDESCDYVLVHDGVRPLVDQATIRRVMTAAREHGAATAGLPARDTLAEVDRKNFIASLPERSRVWQVQTPQGFWRPLLVKAQEKAAAEGHVGTDEAGLLVRMGRPVALVEGSPLNIKLTTHHDLRLARALLGANAGLDAGARGEGA